MWSGWSGYCESDFVVGSHTIATAENCVYLSDQTCKTITGIKLFNSNGTFSTTTTPVEVHNPANYDAASSHDYAMITVQEDLSNYMCFDLGAALDYSSNVPVSGFPQTVNNQTVNNGTIDNEFTSTGSLTDSTTWDCTMTMIHTVETAAVRYI